MSAKNATDPGELLEKLVDNWLGAAAQIVPFLVYDLRWENFSSSDPFFLYRGYIDFNTGGSWWLTWHLSCISCNEDSLNSPHQRDPFVYNNTGSSILFATKNSAKEVDLVAATNNNKNCSENLGLVMNVTNTLNVPSDVHWDGGETCAVMTSSTLSDPCQAKMDSTAASSISSALACMRTDPPVSCPTKDEDSKGTAQRLAAGGMACLGVACLSAALGALGYIVV